VNECSSRPFSSAFSVTELSMSPGLGELVRLLSAAINDDGSPTGLAGFAAAAASAADIGSTTIITPWRQNRFASMRSLPETGGQNDVSRQSLGPRRSLAALRMRDPASRARFGQAAPPTP